MMRLYLLFILVVCFSNPVISQRSVAVTIDDIPNTYRYQQDGGRSVLLEKLDSMRIPVAIFITEGKIYNTDAVVQNFSILDQWIGRDYITPGSHTFSHPRYSATGFRVFTADLVKGTAITAELAKKHHKKLSYFRFPYNDLGGDSLQHRQIAVFLQEQGLFLTPFTIESSDYIFSALYDHYLKVGNDAAAKSTADRYISTTIACFGYFDSICRRQYGREIRQIYLCHENRLNALCLPMLVAQLKAAGYAFISLDEALTDPVYLQPDLIDKKHGISWIYRWMKDAEERKRVMLHEPDMRDIEKAYEALAR